MKTGTSFSDPREISDDGLNEYLKSIGWDEDQEFSSTKWKQILDENIHEYFENKVTADFIIGLAITMYEDALTGDHVGLAGAACAIEELVYTKIDNKKVTYAKKDIDEALSWALKELQNDGK